MVANVTKLTSPRKSRAKAGMQETDDKEPGPRRSLRQEAYELLGDAIQRLELKPGRVTSDSELSRMLGMSRTPVREALTLLERDLLVKRMPNQGVLIRDLSMGDVVHILHMREAIDGMAARLAVDKFDPALLAEIEGEFEAMRGLSADQATTVHKALSRRLHTSILEAAGNPFLESTSRTLSSSFERTRNYNWRIWDASKNSERIAERRYSEHLEIISALKARDPRRAEKAARAHIVSALEDMLRAMIGGR
jgi:DNA-binding GntR family transcriptional regulator